MMTEGIFVFSYGQGTCSHGKKEFGGQIFLTEYKLYLKSDKGEITETFVPLEKIYKIKRYWDYIDIYVRPSTFMQFVARIKSTRSSIGDLVKDLTRLRGLKRKKFGLEWIDEDFFSGR